VKSITFKPLAILFALTLCFSSVSMHVTSDAVAEQAERASSFEKGRYAMIVHDVLRAYPSLGERSTQYRRVDGDELEAARWLIASTVRLQGNHALGGERIDPAGNLAWAARALEYLHKKNPEDRLIEQLLAEAYIVQHDLSHEERAMKRRGGRLKKGFEILMKLAAEDALVDVVGWQVALERLHPVDDRVKLWSLTRTCVSHHGDACYVCVEGCEWLRGKERPEAFKPSRKEAVAAFERHEYEAAVRHILGLYPKFNERRKSLRRYDTDETRYDIALMASAMVQRQGYITLRREPPYAAVTSASAERHLDYALKTLGYLKGRHDEDDVIRARWAVARLSSTRGDESGKERAEAFATLEELAARDKLNALGWAVFAEQLVERGRSKEASEARRSCRALVEDPSLCM